MAITIPATNYKIVGQGNISDHEILKVYEVVSTGANPDRIEVDDDLELATVAMLRSSSGTKRVTTGVVDGTDGTVINIAAGVAGEVYLISAVHLGRPTFSPRS